MKNYKVFLQKGVSYSIYSGTIWHHRRNRLIHAWCTDFNKSFKNTERQARLCEMIKVLDKRIDLIGNILYTLKIRQAQSVPQVIAEQAMPPDLLP